jgi:hypothetical protein
MYYYSLYNRFITDVAGFEKMFKYQHVRAMFERNLSDEDALLGIVDAMRDEWQKATTAARARANEQHRSRQQAAIYSDDRDTVSPSAGSR